MQRREHGRRHGTDQGRRYIAARSDGSQESADNIPSFTLGSVNVSPLSMAAAYATVAARGTYCSPIAIGEIVDGAGESLPVPSARCHQALSSEPPTPWTTSCRAF